MKPNGIFISNGPGDPAAVKYALKNVQYLIGKIPIFGICLGHQILSLALGARTYKLKFGHHGANHPVEDIANKTVMITSQNHGFAVEAPTDGVFTTVFGPGVVTHVCLNDGVVEGLKLLERPAFSVQYHPEAAAGPHDANYLFDDFLAMLESHATR